MPSKAEKRTDEKIGADAPIPGTFLGFRPKADASLEDVKRQQDEAWAKCAQCGVQGRKHPAGGDHQFQAVAA